MKSLVVTLSGLLFLLLKTAPVSGAKIQPTAADSTAAGEIISPAGKRHIHMSLDDNWMASRENGQMMMDQKRFPNGMGGLAEYIHGLGLKLGICWNRGTETCPNQGHFNPQRGHRYLSEPGGHSGHTGGG